MSDFEVMTLRRVAGEPDAEGIRPFLGIRISSPPKRTSMSTSYVNTAVREGWLTLVKESLAHRPGGTTNNPWATTHTFIHAQKLVFSTLDGDITYRVTAQPDKYHPGKKGTDSVGDPSAEIRHYYELELVA